MFLWESVALRGNETAQLAILEPQTEELMSSLDYEAPNRLNMARNANIIYTHYAEHVTYAYALCFHQIMQ